MDYAEDTDNPESRAAGLAPAISIKNLSKSFGSQKILTDISLNIAHGELLVVLGVSGSGKTTLLRIVAGLGEADAGEICLADTCVNQLPPQQRDMGVVFQDYVLFQHMSVE